MPLYTTPPEYYVWKPTTVLQRKVETHDCFIITRGDTSKFDVANSSLSQSLVCTSKSFDEDGVPIRTFKVPANWKQTKRNSKWAYGGQAGYDYEFVPSTKPSSLTLFINWDGTIIPESEHAFWRDIFSAPPHDLSVSELKFLFETAQLNFANPDAFKLTTAKTTLWNGKTVIHCEGDSVAEGEPERHLYAIAFNNNTANSSAGVIGVSGSKSDFEKSKNGALNAMRSIVWKLTDVRSRAAAVLVKCLC